MRIYSIWDGMDADDAPYFPTVKEAMSAAKERSLETDTVWDVVRYVSPPDWEWKDIFFAFANEEGWAKEQTVIAQFVNGKNIHKKDESDL